MMLPGCARFVEMSKNGLDIDVDDRSTPLRWKFMNDYRAKFRL
jgi:hypothetical protein